MRWGALLAAVCLGSVAQAATQTAELVRFVSCPIYRDTDAGRKSGCWLADDHATGKRWDVTESPYKPDWNFAVLVEGRPSADSGAPCGAPALAPVRTSRLDIPCPQHMLPADGFPGRRYTLPRRNIAPLSVPRPVPTGPYGERVFTAFFAFDSDFILYQYDDWLIDRAVTWIRAARPKKLIVTGFAATKAERVGDVVLAERPGTARQRAEMIAETLRRLLPDMTVETRWQTHAMPVNDPEADGLPGQSQRRAEIRAVF